MQVIADQLRLAAVKGQAEKLNGYEFDRCHEFLRVAVIKATGRDFIKARARQVQNLDV